MAKDSFGSSSAGKKGGKARAKALSPEERSEIARRAADARWDREPSSLPRAICGGQDPLRVGQAEIPCYVLEDERRVITVAGMQAGLGMAVGGGATRLVAFARSLDDNPSTVNELATRLESATDFIQPRGGVAKGYEASLLVDFCNAILEARQRGKITPRYHAIALAAEVLVRAFASVGIDALVDEATGFQSVRPRLALQKLLERYITDRLSPWTKTFPDEFYVELFRLKGWDFQNLKPGDKKPAEVGIITREIVYRRLAPGIVQELEKLNPVVVNGRRLKKHHQWLTEDMGHPALRDQLVKIITLMRASDNWMDFERLLQRVIPKKGDQQFFDEFFGDN